MAQRTPASLTHERPRISVVVPAYNEEAFIRGLVESLAGQSYHGPYEVLVADGGSQDRTREIVSELAGRYSWLRLIDNPDRTQAHAFNLGIRACDGEILGYVGAHSELAPDYLEQTVRAFLESGAAAVGGRWEVVPLDERSAAIAIAMRSPFGVGTADYRYRKTPTYTDTVLYGSYLRGPLEEVGGIDESLDVNEDYELNFRLRDAGHRLYFSPDIRITYYSRSSFSKLRKQYFSYGYWKAHVLRLHPRSVRIRHLVAPLFVAGLVLGLPLAALGLIWRAIYLGGLGVYATLSLAISLALAARHGWRHLPVLPAVFALLHLAWGLGFWSGVVHWWIRDGGAARSRPGGAGPARKKSRA